MEKLELAAGQYLKTLQPRCPYEGRQEVFGGDVRVLCSCSRAKNARFHQEGISNTYRARQPWLDDPGRVGGEMIKRRCCRSPRFRSRYWPRAKDCYKGLV